MTLLLASWLRFHALSQDARFHPDEALYNTFARDAVIKGDWLLPGLLDKPPLTIYANALSMAFVGVTVNDAGVLDFPGVRVGEFAGRLPNTMASILLVVLVYALAKRLYRDKSPGRRRAVSQCAMLLVALSPFAIAFSATAFTDVWMVFWMVMALWMAACDRWAVSGLCLALGFASKQSALLYLPLILAVGLTLNRLSWRRLSAFAALFLAGFGLLLVWDLARGQPTIWQVSASRENYPNRLVHADELLPRLTIWLDYAQWLIGPGPLTALLCALVVVQTARRFVREPRTRSARLDGILLAYVLGYGLLHWLAAFNTFDRYLLPLVPLLAVLAARGIQDVTHRIRNRLDNHSAAVFSPSSISPLWTVGLSPLSGEGPGRGVFKRNRFASLLLYGFALSLFLAAWDASEGRTNVGGDLGEHDGIDALAEYLNSKPVAAVVYDHWLGWELAYYLGPWNDKRRVYYPTPEALVRDALLLAETGPRYFPVPDDQEAAAWLAALHEAGFAPSPVFAAGRFVVYELIPPRNGVDAANAG